jgi:hypothetical protein
MLSGDPELHQAAQSRWGRDSVQSPQFGMRGCEGAVLPAAVVALIQMLGYLNGDFGIQSIVKKLR